MGRTAWKAPLAVMVAMAETVLPENRMPRTTGAFAKADREMEETEDREDKRETEAPVATAAQVESLLFTLRNPP